MIKGVGNVREQNIIHVFYQAARSIWAVEFAISILYGGLRNIFLFDEYTISGPSLKSSIEEGRINSGTLLMWMKLSKKQLEMWTTCSQIDQNSLFFVSEKMQFQAQNGCFCQFFRCVSECLLKVCVDFVNLYITKYGINEWKIEPKSSFMPPRRLLVFSMNLSIFQSKLWVVCLRTAVLRLLEPLFLGRYNCGSQGLTTAVLRLLEQCFIAQKLYFFTLKPHFIG